MKNSTGTDNGQARGSVPASVIPLFPLGQTVATPGTLALLDHVGVNASVLLARHQSGDFGDIDQTDRAANASAIRSGARILSAYLVGRGERIWIITDADRSFTTLLLPTEY